ncbi:MAG: hypothetical protein QXJ74_09910 [Nitrososphaera sp.]|uniref:hypothetical protein n=1 Tax=Nitrososphaera sp. TaxID=1971748 RepID=UPI0017C3E676|nr:hypothetical protein [Nitrososphaera sp.]NWG37193.1 hypothetical protein [Nitrososphaera sp.]
MPNGQMRIYAAALVGISLVAIGAALPLGAFFAGNGRTAEGLAFKGNVDIALYDEFGVLKDERHIDNLIVDAGVQGVASRLAPHDGSINPTTPYNYIALGTGSTAVAAGDTALAAELTAGPNYARLQDTTAQYSESTKKLVLSVTFAPGQGTGALRESGIFNAAAGGNMFARQTFAEIQKASGDTLTVTWTITLTPS